MLNKLKELVNRNDSLYVIAKCVKNSKNPEMIKLIRGFYSQPQNNLTLIFNSSSKFPKESVYYIDLGVEDSRDTGFCALLHYTIGALCFADSLGFLPFVKWGSGTAYYENELASFTDNVFLYYFEPVSEASKIENKQCISWKLADIEYYMKKKWDAYRSDDEEMFACASSYKKYIHLNLKTSNFIDQNMKLIFNGKKILGIHARGTDYNVGFKDHPIVITSRMYIEKARALFESGNYDRIFIATEDTNLLNSFIEAFGETLVYYRDVCRSGNKTSPHVTSNKRPLHHYRLGLEVLRDVYTLANCDSLICGLSQVSFAARYVNIALGRKFDEVIVLDNGINEGDSKAHK